MVKKVKKIKNPAKKSPGMDIREVGEDCMIAIELEIEASEIDIEDP